MILGEKLRTALRQCRNGLFLALVWCAQASAGVIDGVEIGRLGGLAQITVRFTTEIQYLRHAPDREGRQLRIFFRVTKPGFAENDLMQEVRPSPPSELVPPFTLTYPELVNAMLISFARPTNFLVRPGNDSRSMVILVPLAAGAPVVAAANAPPAPAVAEIAPGPAPDAAAIPLAESPEQLEANAANLLREGREALAGGDYPRAINRLNRILGLPANAQTMAAQALLGEAREKNGEIAKARAEYELFLKLYPEAAAAAAIASSPSAAVHCGARAITAPVDGS